MRVTQAEGALIRADDGIVEGQARVPHVPRPERLQVRDSRVDHLIRGAAIASSKGVIHFSLR